MIVHTLCNHLLLELSLNPVNILHVHVTDFLSMKNVDAEFLCVQNDSVLNLITS